MLPSQFIILRTSNAVSFILTVIQRKTVGLIHRCRPFKLSEELLAKWLTFPETQHVPLSQHMLGFAMKAVMQSAMGSRFEDDQEVIRFRRNHDAVRLEEE